VKPKNLDQAMEIAEQSKPILKGEISTESDANKIGGKLQKKISAKSAIIMDADSGQTLFAVSPDTPRQPASTIKILTGLIAIKSLDFSESVAVSHKAAEQPSSKVNLNQQKQYKAHDLINAVLLSSANDASVALAEKIAGSEQSFAQMMTMRAKLCGAQNTVCKTANGLTAEGQSSTARDLATIFRHAMQDDEFSQRMKQVKTHTAEGQLLRNHNKALWQIKGAEGGKTGFTNAAGQTYVGKFKRGPKEIIVAIMGSNTMWADLKTLVEYGFAQPASTVAEASQDVAKSRIVASIPAVSPQQ
jgi:D-alanyl-D-alanine carboxypeptidase (penicillin-binding protein 5/6)